MAWWDVVLDKVNPGDKLFTPGRGLKGSRRKPFTIVSKDTSKIIIKSGGSKVHLEKTCFDVIEKVLSEDPSLWLRVASLHDTEPLEDSADKLIREATGSQLACGNYVCSILEHCGLVRYSMSGNKKGIELPREPKEATQRFPLGKDITFVEEKIPYQLDISKTDIIVDGSNVAYGSGTKPNAKNIRLMVDTLKGRGFKKVIVIVDAALRHKIGDTNILSELQEQGIIHQAPAKTPSDKFILQFARKMNARIITNDTFKDWAEKCEWVKANIDKYRIPFMIIDGQVEIYWPV